MFLRKITLLLLICCMAMSSLGIAFEGLPGDANGDCAVNVLDLALKQAIAGHIPASP